MEKNKLFFFILIYYFSVTTSVISQISFFDSINVIASSNKYDYKNPKFDKYGWLVYERHSGNGSNIVIRKSEFNSFGPEILITNSQKALNINPTISENILVWQSNERGNWDLFYSNLTNNSWSKPAILDSSSANETNPCIDNNNTYPIQYNFHFLAYKRDNNVRMKIRSTLTEVWFLDTNITLDTGDYTEPTLVDGPNSNQSSVIYLKKYSDDLSRINVRTFAEPLTVGNISMLAPYEVYQPNSQNNLTLTFSSGRFITYSYDTLSSKHLLGFGVGGHNFKEVFTKNIPGRHYRGKGSPNPIITDNLLYMFSVFCSLSKNNDSTQLILINRLNSFNNNPNYKKIYLGDTSVFVKFDLSFIEMQGSLFKVKAVWENQLNGKTALFDSYMTDVYAEIFNQNMHSEKFLLSQNYPNPFNPNTVISYHLSVSSFTSLKVYDVLGNEVTSLVNTKQHAGNYDVEFDGSNLTSGIYFYKLETESAEGGFNEVKKMILIK